MRSLILGQDTHTHTLTPKMEPHPGEASSWGKTHTHTHSHPRWSLILGKPHPGERHTHTHSHPRWSLILGKPNPGATQTHPPNPHTHPPKGEPQLGDVCSTSASSRPTHTHTPKGEPQPGALGSPPLHPHPGIGPSTRQPPTHHLHGTSINPTTSRTRVPTLKHPSSASFVIKPTPGLR